jgi:cardiolipin synthase
MTPPSSAPLSSRDVSPGTVEVPFWVAGAAGATFGGLLLLLWSLKRRTPLWKLPDQHGIADLGRTIAGLTQSTLCDGNAVELVQNGAFFDRLLADIAAAENSVHVETFLCKEGEATRRLAVALAERARAGVTVRVLLDANGGRGFGDEGLRQIREAGASVSFFRPLRARTLGRVNKRDHRKLAILDGRIGWVGGHCLTDHWLGDAEDDQHYRDISARVQGPVVAQMQAAFAEHWIEETGETFGGDDCFPPLEPRGDATAHAVWASPASAPSCVSLLFTLAIHGAAKSITLQNPYFLPDPEDRRLLTAAARRGVHVRVMAPSPGASDAPFVQHAGHHHFGDLLAAGVEIYEYQRTLLHQKVITVDGVWSAVGSANFDDRSFEINDEVMLVVHGESLARELEEIFERDLAHARRMHLEDWHERSWRHKLADLSLYLVNEQL